MAHENASYERLHFALKKWIHDQGWTALKTIQEQAIPVIIEGESDVIISAATAGGKTEAVFLPILTRMLEEPLPAGYAVLYVSPLKALINDQYRRLLDLTKNLDIVVTPWHGDISAPKKNRSLQHPSGILIITPESLESLFMNRAEFLMPALGSLQYIVIDELHAFIGSERGQQLQSLLSRVELLSKHPIPRLAMSATFSDFDIVKDFLRPDHRLPCVIPSPGDKLHETQILIKSYSPNPDQPSIDARGESREPFDEGSALFDERNTPLDKGNAPLEDEKTLPDEAASPSGESRILNAVAQEIFSTLRGSSNLIFANSRYNVENYALMLGDMCEKNGVPNEFRVHHGSLSRRARETVEHELQKGDRPLSVLCTSTLELGVDIGKVRSIVQIDRASSVSALRQRLGRSGRRYEPSRLKILSVEYDEKKGFLSDLRASLVQNIAVVELLKQKKYETPEYRSYHFSTLIQQILSIIVQYGGFYPKDGWQILCQYGAFRHVSSTVFLQLLRDLGQRQVVSQMENGQIIVGLEGERILRQRDFYAAFNVSVDYVVYDNEQGQHLGEIQFEPKLGESIVIGGRRWLTNKIEPSSKKVYVTLLQQTAEAEYFGSAVEVNRMVCEKMREVYLSSEVYPYLSKKTATDQRLAEGRAYFLSLNLQHTAFVKGQGMLTWAGHKINRTIALMATKTFDYMVGYNHLAVNTLDAENIKAILKKGKPKAKDLASLVSLSAKRMQKYDHYLSDDLLDLDYAMTYLDIDAAWDILQNAPHGTMS